MLRNDYWTVHAYYLSVVPYIKSGTYTTLANEGGSVIEIFSEQTHCWTDSLLLDLYKNLSASDCIPKLFSR